MNIIISKGKENTKLPKIVRASIHLFVAKGVDATTIKDIAEEAGVAEGALYRHYKSKDELAWKIFQTHLNQFTTELMGKVLGEKGSLERIRTVISECFSAFEEDRDLFSYLILSEHKEFKNYPDQHPGHVVLRIIEEGQRNGEIRAGEPYILGACFIGTIIRICLVQMYSGIPKTLQDHVKETTEIIWSALKSQQVTP